MTNLIGISGKMGSGKNTVATFIQLLVMKQKLAEQGKELFTSIETTIKVLKNWPDEERLAHSGWRQKAYGDHLKQICSLLLDQPIEKFYDEEFKSSKLGPEWERYKLINSNYESLYFRSREDAKMFVDGTNTGHPYKGMGSEELTVRSFMQYLATEALRKVVHPYIWINSLFANYKEIAGKYPNWIINDVRFFNEFYAVRDRCGIIIRVNRPWDQLPQNPHTRHCSETELDEAPFDYVIENDEGLIELLAQVEDILKKEKLLS